jgi:hypothetical protein
MYAWHLSTERSGIFAAEVFIGGHALAYRAIKNPLNNGSTNTLGRKIK